MKGKLEAVYTIYRSPPSPCCTLADSTVSYEPWQAGADVGRAAGVAALSTLGNVTRMGALFAGVRGSIRLWGEEKKSAGTLWQPLVCYIFLSLFIWKEF